MKVERGTLVNSQEIYKNLPVMKSKAPANWVSLEISGSIEWDFSLQLEDLLAMPQSNVTADFQCNDGWKCLNLEWSGVTIKYLLEGVGLFHNANRIEFRSGEYCQVLSLEEALDSSTVVALRLNGKPLPKGNGGPCRLLAGSRKGPAHVKWLQTITVIAV
jgi:DMSO/TMAO reductase YedYZ molybdopterin-dependent catalytic subunit